MKINNRWKTLSKEERYIRIQLIQIYLILLVLVIEMMKDGI